MNSSEGPEARPPADILRDMIFGYRLSQLIYVAVKLGIAELLEDGPKSSDELGKAAGANPRNLARVLRALAAYNIFEETEDGRYALNPLGDGLRLSTIRNSAIMWGDASFWRPWGELFHNVKTGETACEHAFGMDFWTYLDKNPESAAAFDAGMTTRSDRELSAIMETYDFSRFKTIVDVAGGQGRLLTSILKKCPESNGILFDQPSVIESARQLVHAEALQNRCELIGGNFFDTVPQGGDAYILQTILHDWDDEQAEAILKSCRRAMDSEAKLVVIDSVMTAGPGAVRDKVSDITMMVLVNGMERTEDQFKELFRSSGFQLVQLIRTPFRCIIEGEPI